MASSPRILRVVPRGNIVRPEHPMPVFARLQWHDGRMEEVPAIAVAWTREAVEIEWEPAGSNLRSDWIPANDVRRPGQPSKEPIPRPRPQRRGGWGRG